MVSLLKGQELSGGDSQEAIDTVNALGVKNGRQILATVPQVQELKDHIRTFQSPYTDLRPQIRQIEEDIFTNHAGFLIGNQCIDFQKQDGITEIEEAIMANTIERRLNDLLLRDEAASVLTINRKPIYVSCVSNFTNFLDLSRKTIRSLEVGIPCVILSRSNTSQHPYRWVRLLNQLLAEHDVDPGMLTFLSCSLPDIQDITTSCAASTGNLYTTCSRELAATIKSTYPNTIASTGGPNTLVATEFNPKIAEAIRTSATIESSGQCTALRMAVVPTSTSDEELEGVFDSVEQIKAAPDAVQESVFAGVFAKHTGSGEPDSPNYSAHETVDAFWKIGNDLPAPGINEFWRKVAVDFSRLDLVKDETKSVARLADWLNENQPISLAVNGPRKQAINMGISLFEKTGMVVNTIGSSDNDSMPPALTCQARPQEGEIFGEFPPRSKLHTFTKFPVVVPSSNPSYDTEYTEDYLQSQTINKYMGKGAKVLLEQIKNDSIRGFCIVLIEYLQDVCKLNPKEGYGKSRTALWGMQRPPLGSRTSLRCSSDATWDDVAPIHLLFWTTNARDQVELSIDPQNSKLISFCKEHKLPHVEETESAMTERLESRSDVFNSVAISGPMTSFPMVGQFVSLYFPLGHIKSTMPNDEEFAFYARLSDKWINTLF
jgi:hypothetical protein